MTIPSQLQRVASTCVALAGTALVGCALWNFVASLTARAQSARPSGVPEAMRELEQAESRLRGGVYQVPLVEAAPEAPKQTKPNGDADGVPKSSTSPARRAGSAEPLGIDIAPQEEAGEKTSRALTDIAAAVAEIQARTTDVRSRILTLQDEMASRLDAVSYAKIILIVKDPSSALAASAGASPRVTSGASMPLPLAVHELSAALDDIPLVERHHPRRLEREARFPLYEGPLPAGEHTLRLRLVIGLLSSGWPSQVGQGRWLVEESFPLKHSPSRTSGGTLATLTLEPALGGARPKVTLTLAEAKK